MVGSFKVYIASKARQYPYWQALRAAGLPINSTWLDWLGNRGELELTEQDWREHSETCLREAADCDVLLLHAQDEENHFGALLEAGAALAAGKKVFLVAPHHWPFLRCHPLVQSFDSLADAISCLIAREPRSATPSR
jgi:hypothetical protein